MKKIGIVTLYRNNNNYGGQLQAYAMQKLFTTDNSVAQLISFETRSDKYIVKRICDLGPSKFMINACRKVLFREFVKRNPIGSQYDLRMRRFKIFQDGICHTELYSETDIETANESFDLFVCGSDQVWNPGWWNSILLLRFAHKPKYAYAASIGREVLGNVDKNMLKTALRDYRAVSVREKQAEDLLREILDKEIPLVLDPTLLINREVWSRIAALPQHEERYALLYMLGDDWDMKKKIYTLCKSLGVKVIEIALEKDLYYSAQLKYADLFICDAGPSQWLGWIANADYVFTDSFHGTVFSVIFEKMFWCFMSGKKNNRKNINSRLYSFLTLAGLSERMIYRGEHLNRTEIQSAIDYEAVQENLRFYRETSLGFIKRITE